MNESPIHNTNNNRQQTVHHLSSASLRRPKTEHVSVLHPISDMIDLPLSQHSLTIPLNFTFRPPSSRITRPNRTTSLKLDRPVKTMNENPVKPTFLLPSKSFHQSPTATSIPQLTEQDSIHTRTLTSTLYAKSRLIKQWKKHQQLSAFDRSNTQEKSNDIQELYITPQVLNHVHREDSMKKNNSMRHIRWMSDDCKYSRKRIMYFRYGRSFKHDESDKKAEMNKEKILFEEFS